jgi:hypothetical protein
MIECREVPIELDTAVCAMSVEEGMDLLFLSNGWPERFKAPLPIVKRSDILQEDADCRV